MNSDTLSFVVYMIHACAARWGKAPTEVYHLLDSTDCINSYLVQFYDVLHSLGSDYLVDDIQKYLSVRGVAV